MQHPSRKYFNDLFWLALSVAVTVVLTFFFFGKSIFHSELDMHLHDTYFIISKCLILISLFLLITFIIFFIKACSRKDNTEFAYCICVLSGLALVIALTIFIKRFSQNIPMGWSIHPPLSALSPEEISKMKSEFLPAIIVKYLLFFQVIILCMCIFSAYRCGRIVKQKSL